ncbi:MAG: DUF1669 domain-containing protein [Phycisphaerae bacterium]|nr:DUF1669 domain-containing protein [Saprospiraceae bacterium]
MKSQIAPYFQNIEHHVISHIGKAQKNILVAMAWLTNSRIISKLLEVHKRGVVVEVIVDANDKNKESVDLKKLHENGIKIRFSEGLKELVEKRTMHNKFCVIDNVKVITGSYNWSYPAEKYHNENIVIIEDEHVALDYRLEFRRLDFSNLFVIEFESFNQSNQTYIEKFKNSILVKLRQIIESQGDFKNYEGSLADFDLGEIRQEIKATVEETTLLIKSKTARFWGYLILIDEYGQDWKNHAPPEKITRHDNKNREDLIAEIENATINVLDNIRFKGLCQVWGAYMNQLQSSVVEENTLRIMRVQQFLLSERKKVAEKLGIVVIPPSLGNRISNQEKNRGIKSEKQWQEILPEDFSSIYKINNKERQN